MKQYILFDLDGTLTDPMIGITSSVQYALASFGIEERNLRTLIPFIGPPLKESFMKYYGLSDEQGDQAVEKYREYFGPKGIFENEVYPGIADMLCKLRDRGYTLILATSKPWVYAKQILSHFDLDGYISYVSGSELSGERTDKAEVIAHALELAGAKPEEAVMVGDREHDIIGAKKCAVTSVGVIYGYGGRDELERAGADKIVSSVEELSVWLDKLNF